MKSPRITELARELSVLAEAISYPNLSGASQNIGISQPQLSRMVAKLEKSLGVILLNREVKRQAAWTPIAHEVAQTYSRNSRHIEAELQRLITETPLRQLRLATLEGLMPIAAEMGHRLMHSLKLESLELDVLDLSELEERFLRGDLDVVLTMREPGRKKYSFSKTLGYQSLNELSRSARSPAEEAVQIQSGFEFHSRPKAKKTGEQTENHVVSNSLAVRKYWLDHFGGIGLFPSELQQKSSGSKSEMPVLLLGSEVLGQKLWKTITATLTAPTR